MQNHGLNVSPLLFSCEIHRIIYFSKDTRAPTLFKRRIMRPRAVPDVVKVLVFGAGAIGSLIGGLLSIENEVTLVTRKAHADVINRRGLRISGTNARLVHPTATTEVPVE